MIISKQNNGSVRISDIINNQYLYQTYYGYSLRECKSKFKQYIKKIINQ